MSALGVLRYYTTPNINKDIDMYMGIQVLHYHRTIKWTNFNNKYHRIGHPASIEWVANSQHRREGWYYNGMRYRVNNEPSHIEYDHNTIIAELWLDKYSRLNRDTLPAVITYYKKNTICVAEWYKDDKHYRANGGPDYIVYDTQGTMVELHWKRLFGTQVDGIIRIDYCEGSEMYSILCRKNVSVYNRLEMKDKILKMYQAEEYDEIYNQTFC